MRVRGVIVAAGIGAFAVACVTLSPRGEALVVAGAKEHRLPGAYVAALEAAATREDPKPERAAQNVRLVAVLPPDQAARTTSPG